MTFSQALYSIIQARVKAGYMRSGVGAYNLTLRDADKLKSVADKYGFPPEWLANLINFETAGTFNPAITNSIGATGLIQFLRSTAEGLGTSTDELRKMDFSEQMDWVDKYIQVNMNSVVAGKGLYNKSTGKVSKNFTQQDLFMIIFYPVAVGNPLFTFPASVTNANAGIQTPVDYTNKALAATTAPFKNVVDIVADYVVQGIETSKNFFKQNIIPIAITGTSLLALTFLIIYNRKAI